MTLPEKIEELHGIHDATYFRYVPGIPRLNIPPLHVANGPAGVGACRRAQGAQVARPLCRPNFDGVDLDVGTAERYGALIGSEAKDLDEICSSSGHHIARVRRAGAPLRRSAKTHIWWHGWGQCHSRHSKSGRDRQRQTFRGEQSRSRSS